MAIQLGVDPRSLNQLAAQTQSGRSPEATQKVARQFEAVFADMMIHSMRAVHLGSDMLGRGGQLYTSLYDWQIAEDMTRGRGLGIASMLMRQLQGAAATGPSQPASLHPLDASDRLAGTAPALRPTQSAAVSVPSPRPLDAADHFSGPDPVAAPTTMGVASPAAPAAPAPPGPAASLTSSVLGFVQRLWPQAQSVAQKLGVSVRAVIAQAALETGWGQHEAAPHNLFGIKASGAESGTERDTTEYAGATPTQTIAKFRRFPSDNAAMTSYATLIGTDPRYHAVQGSGDDVRRFASALQQAGYATDPGYAQKLIAVANDPRLITALNTVAGALTE